MKVVIPAKAGSLRVENKNFREFVDGKSLLDITIEKALAVVPADSIYVSCEDESKRPLIEKWGVNFLVRDARLCDNDTPFHDVFNGVVDDVPGDDDIAWCQVIDPMFNEYAECFQRWEEVRHNHDSLVVVYPLRKYLLNPDFTPRGFGFREKHVKSQLLPTHYELTFTLAILTRDCVKESGYWVGQKPHWYECTTDHVDIDTPEEYAFAGHLYKLRFPT